MFNFIVCHIGNPLSLVDLLVHFVYNFLQLIMLFSSLSSYLFNLVIFNLKLINFGRLFGFSGLIWSDDVLLFGQNSIKLHTLFFKFHLISNLGFSFLILQTNHHTVLVFMPNLLYRNSMFHLYRLYLLIQFIARGHYVILHLFSFSRKE